MGNDGKVFFAICLHILGTSATVVMFTFLCIKTFDTNTPLLFNVFTGVIMLISLTWLAIGTRAMLGHN